MKQLLKALDKNDEADFEVLNLNTGGKYVSVNS